MFEPYEQCGVKLITSNNAIVNPGAQGFPNTCSTYIWYGLTFATSGHYSDAQLDEAAAVIRKQIDTKGYGKLILTSICRGERWAYNDRWIEALKRNGWQEIYEFPGNYGPYKNCLLVFLRETARPYPQIAPMLPNKGPYDQIAE